MHLKQFVDMRNAIVQLLEIHAAKDGEIESYIKERAERTLGNLGNVHYYISFVYGCRAANWNPEVLVFGFKSTRGTVLKAVDGKWYDCKGQVGEHTEIYKKRTQPVDEPITSKLLEDNMHILGNRIGLPVRQVIYKLQENPEHPPRDREDLLLEHPSAQVVVEGNFWYTGWDIPDKWAFVQDEDGVYIYLSNGAHSSYYTVCVGPEDSLDLFHSAVRRADSIEGEIPYNLIKDRT